MFCPVPCSGDRNDLFVHRESLGSWRLPHLVWPVPDSESRGSGALAPRGRVRLLHRLVAGDVGAPVTPTELRDGLLDADQGAIGVVPLTGHADDDGGRAVFQGAGCEELTRLLNAEKLPGSRAEAAVALSIGPEGTAAAEQLYAMGSAEAAGKVVERYRRSVKECAEITLSVDGAGTSTSSVRPLPLVVVGDASFASAVRPADEESLAGHEVVQVVAHSGALVIAVTLMGASSDHAERVARAAVHKVRHELNDRPGPSGPR